MSFTTTKLAGHRVLVEGTDKNSILGREVLDSTQWDRLTEDTGHSAAHQAFDKAIEKFYAPLTKAAEALEAAHKGPAEDVFSIVTQEAVPATPGQREIRESLTHDSAVLRILEQSDADQRLIWVNDHLEIVAP